MRPRTYVNDALHEDAALFDIRPLANCASSQGRIEQLGYEARMAQGTNTRECEMDEARKVAAGDPQETQEWVDAISGVIAFEGPDRADELLGAVIDTARRGGAKLPFAENSAYLNTIPPDQQLAHP